MASKRRNAISDDELLSIVNAEVDSASGYASGELADERSTAMDYYLGEPYGDEQDGRSQYISREVMETIQNILPSLLRIFGEADNLISFDPVGPEDTEQAKQETDRVSYAFWKENRGFYNILSFCQDALLSKTGVLQAEWADPEPEREEYQNLSDMELMQLMQDTSVEREVVEADITPNGYHIVFEATPIGHVQIDPVPPEEVGVNRDARSPYFQDCKFVYVRRRKSKSELLAEGFKESDIDQIPTSDDTETEERLARRHLADESDILRVGSNPSMRTFWVTYCYIRIDRDGDGISELLRVVVAAGAGQTAAGARLLGVEEVDQIPVFGAPPHLLTHKFYGLSIADLVMDIQKILSNLDRQVLDNVYRVNNSGTHVNENVSVDDLLTNRPGRIVRHKGETVPGQNMAPEPVTQLPPDIYQMMERLDGTLRERTGASEDVSGLDVGALANLNTGVAAMALDRVRMKVELIAQILCEVGLKPLFSYMHSLLQKKQDKREVVELRGKWVEVNPSEWRERKNLTVNVGVGIASRERKLMSLEDIWSKQQAVVQGGGLGQIVVPQNLFNLLADHAEAWGLDSERYWTNPETVPPQPPAPDPQMLLQQSIYEVEMAKIQDRKEQRQVDVEKMKADIQLKVMEMRSEETQAEFEKQIQALENERTAIMAERDQAQGDAKLMLDTELKSRDQELEVLKMRMEDERKAAGQQIDLYKSLLQASVANPQQLSLAGINVPEPEDEREDQAGELDEMKRYVGNLLVTVQEMRERETAPKTVERDGSGKPVSIGGRPIVYNSDGLIERID